jgi:uncharacterized membrane protein YidH (DUF202 family)
MTALATIIAKINSNIINPMIFLMLALAFVIFLWGLISYFQNVDNAEERATGLRHMIWGMVGLLIMISVKGIIALIQNLVG